MSISGSRHENNKIGGGEDRRNRKSQVFSRQKGKKNEIFFSAFRKNKFCGRIMSRHVTRYWVSKISLHWYESDLNIMSDLLKNLFHTSWYSKYMTYVHGLRIPNTNYSINPLNLLIRTLTPNWWITHTLQ